MKTTALRLLGAVAAVAAFGCSTSPGQHQANGYALDGQPGRAAQVYGSPQAAQAAFRVDESACEQDTERNVAVPSVQPGGGLFGAIFTRGAYDDRRERLFQSCMGSRRWLPVRVE